VCCERTHWLLSVYIALLTHRHITENILTDFLHPTMRPNNIPGHNTVLSNASRTPSSLPPQLHRSMHESSLFDTPMCTHITWIWQMLVYHVPNLGHGQHVHRPLHCRQCIHFSIILLSVQYIHTYLTCLFASADQ
jgi:hypothetical protein